MAQPALSCLTALMTALVVTSAACAAATSPAEIERHGDKVTCCDPEQEGVDSRRLLELTEWIRDQQLPLFSLLISRNGRLVYELYPASLTRDAAHYQMSVTKSVLSALIGIAIDQRLIAGPDAPVTETLPRRLFASDAEQARFRALTVRHVLGMSALDAPDPPRSRTPEALARQRRFWSETNRVRFALEQPLLADHGRAFQYNDVTPLLASGLLQYASGKTALEFAEEHLFKPMRFANYEWMHQDRAGIDNGGYGLRLRPIDMQKFGLLYMNGGRWGDRQLVPASWVRESYTPWIRSSEDASRPNYGWFWWSYGAGREWPGLVANGWKGQRIAVFPRQKVVVTMTACIEGDSDRAFNELVRSVARSVGEGTLPANPAAQSKHAARLADVSRSLPSSCPSGGPRMTPSIERKEKRIPFQDARQRN